MRKYIDVRCEGHFQSSDIRRMRENKFSVLVSLFRGCSSDVHGHGLYFPPSNPGAGEEFDDVRAAGEVVVHGSNGRCGCRRLGKDFSDLGRQITQVVRDSVGRIEGHASGQNARPCYFTGGDAVANCNSVGKKRAGIDNRCEAVARKYIGELRGQFFGWLRRGIDPFLLGEMYVAILKGGGNHCALAIDLLCVGRNGQCARLADRCDLFATDYNSAIGDRRIGGRRIDFRSYESDNFGVSRSGSAMYTHHRKHYDCCDETHCEHRYSPIHSVSKPTAIEFHSRLRRCSGKSCILRFQ